MNIKQLIENKSYTFFDTSFEMLMQKRIYKVLIISNAYDLFMLEEDGRIEERLFFEYTQYNLRFPPQIFKATNVNSAFNILEEENIDLIIIMLNIGEDDAFTLSKKIKINYPNKPIVLLSLFSRELINKLTTIGTHYFDDVYCWLGNTDILLSIIKLLEDKMNLKHDVKEVGVQAILFVEDNIRYYSSYLPHLYRLVFQQSQRAMQEGLNEHQKMMLMRGRPKILHAKTYNEAEEIFNNYKENLLGIICDIDFPRENQEDPEAGIKFLEYVKKEDEFMPFILQSSDTKYESYAISKGVGFINKYSKSLSFELRNYLIKHFAFGDFIFRDPKTNLPIDAASDLKSLQEKIFKIPDETLEYHVKQNHFSKWLMARALFPIAKMLKYVRFEDFNSIDELKMFLYDVIDTYRKYRGQGVIAKFDSKRIDEYLTFSRIGEGSLGGKARGIAFLDNIIKKYELNSKYENVNISIPKTIVISSDIFDEFMEANGLYKIALSSDISNEEIITTFVESKLPGNLLQDLYAIIDIFDGPIAIRSSSKLEDSQYQPFAGVYNTYMIPNIKNDKQKTIKLLTDAIKSVYASVFFKESKSYITATSNIIDEEKMSVVIQQIVGSRYGNYYFPVISGVARSINFYPIDQEKPEDGVVNIAFGLGKYVVDGGKSLRFSPKYPQKILQLSNVELSLKNSQNYFYALNLDPDYFVASQKDDINISRLYINELSLPHNLLNYIVSSYDANNNIIYPGIYYEGKKIITFENILVNNSFPLAKVLDDILQILYNETNTHIEIEFAVNIDCDKKIMYFYLLQIRPVVLNKEFTNINFEVFNNNDCILSSINVLGNGILDNIYDLILIKKETYKPQINNDLVYTIEKLNKKLSNENRLYILAGYGRWGSSDPWLGIPVKWAQISNAKVIIEIGLPNFNVEPSQGTHFFQNITSLSVVYITINPFSGDGFFNFEFLNSLPVEYEDTYIKHIRCTEPFITAIDGKLKKGVILKPGIKLTSVT
ncbi:MAG: phosphoenolpyruvate synthase [Bacteroidales bacterium]|nr:phosphoenolpyruvate synthase [Bacteroidales bacterium]